MQSHLEQPDILAITETAQGQEELCLLCSLLVPKIEPASEQVLNKHLLNEWMNDWMAVTGSRGPPKHFHEAKAPSSQS